MVDTPPLSRRRLLRTIGTAGAIGAAGGAGVRAYLADDELFPDNRVTVGSLDLAVDVTVQSSATVVTDRTDGTLSVGFDGIDPGDEGVVDFAYAVCDNPGWVWLRVTPSDGATGPLGSVLETQVWRDDDCQADLDGSDPVYFDGTVDGLLQSDFGTGARLDSACTRLGKLEYADGTLALADGSQAQELTTAPLTYEFPLGERTVDLQIHDLIFEEGEFVGFDIRTVNDAPGLCGVTVAGGRPAEAGGTGRPSGPKTVRYAFDDCPRSRENLYAPEKTQSGDHYAVSHIAIDACDPTGCVGCAPTCLGFGWRLPQDLDSSLSTESLALDFEFATEQCRRNPDPTNPWRS